jgi:hypothetical protein
MLDPAIRAPLAAALLDPRDDVATALIDLSAGARVPLANGETQCTVDIAEPIPAGHKFALHAVDKGWRVRKYGEYIGRMTRDVGPGEWIHVHNLATAALRSESDDAAWRAQAAPASVRDVADAPIPSIAARDAQGRTWRASGDPSKTRNVGEVCADRGIALRDLARPSGIGFRSDGALLVVEAGRATIRAFELDHDRICEARTLVDAMALPGDLWGLAVDDADGMWCVLRDAGCLLHYDADGALREVLRLPVRDVVACSLLSEREVLVSAADGAALAVGVTS